MKTEGNYPQKHPNVYRETHMKRHTHKIAVALALTASLSGNAEAADGTIQGFGNSAPLSDAATLIAPPDWKTKITAPSIKNEPVSWKSGETWQDTLKNIATSHDLHLTITPNNKTITLAPGSETVSAPAQTDKNTAPLCTPTPAKKTAAKKTKKRTYAHNRHSGTFSKSRTEYASQDGTWPGSSRFDSPTIYGVPAGEAAAMTNPVQGSPLGNPQPMPNTSTGQAASSLAYQNAEPKYGQTYVASRPVLPTAQYGLAYPSASTAGSRTWTAKSGETVDQIIKRWAAQSGEGWQVYSDKAHQPLYIRANISINSTFTDAVRELTEDFHGNITPVVSVHESGIGKIVTITDSDHASPSTD